MTGADGEILDRVIERLYRLRQSCGSDAFHAAASRTLNVIARLALEEAERRARLSKGGTAVIIRFPIEFRRRKNADD
jgi:hypothetical protein